MRRGLRLFQLLLGVSCALACIASPAQALVSVGGGFYFQSPQPFGWSLASVSFASPEDVWAVANTQNNGQRLLHSSDAGTTWQALDIDVDAGHNVYFSGLTFVDAEHGRALTSWHDLNTGNDQIALVKTDDGGATWRLVPIATGDFLSYDACFPSSDDAVVSGREYHPASTTWQMVMLTTRDGGASWQRTTLPTDHAYDLETTDMVHFWCRGFSEDHTVYTSSDGGVTWQSHAGPSNVYSLDSLLAVDVSHAWALTTRQKSPYHQVFRTVDAGKSWQLVKDLPNGAASILSVVSATEAYLSVKTSFLLHESSCYVEHTTDGGASWTRTYVGPTSVGGVVVGPSGIVLGTHWRSLDSSATWQRLITDRSAYMLEGVTADAGGGLWAVGTTTPGAPGIYTPTGGNGVLFRSADGVRWRQKSIPRGASLRTIDFFGTRYGYAAGSSGRVLRTTDGGSSWRNTSGIGSLFVHDIEATSARSAVAVVSRVSTSLCGIARTADGGKSWRVKTFKGDDLRAICSAGGNKLIVAGTRDTATALVLTSTDGGSSWTRKLVPCPWQVQDATFTDARHGFVLASDSAWWSDFTSWGTRVLRTTDGGKSWTTCDLGTVSTYGLNSLVFSAGKTGWAVGDCIVKTTDGGATWSDTGAAVPGPGTAPAEVPALYAAATSGGDLWAVGSGQLILSSRDSSSDTAPPVSCDDGDRLWHASAVTTHIISCDPGGTGVVRIQYRIGSGAWRTLSGDSVIIAAPRDHSGDGDHAIRYRAIDAAGNVEYSQVCTVHMDTRKPQTEAGGTVAVRSGSTVKLPYLVKDAAPNGGTATVTITIRDADGTTVDKLALGEEPVNKKLTATYCCALAAGTYSYRVSATDAAGNKQSRAASGRLVVEE